MKRCNSPNQFYCILVYHFALKIKEPLIVLILIALKAKKRVSKFLSHLHQTNIIIKFKIFLLMFVIWNILVWLSRKRFFGFSLDHKICMEIVARRILISLILFFIFATNNIKSKSWMKSWIAYLFCLIGGNQGNFVWCVRHTFYAFRGLEFK